MSVKHVKEYYMNILNQYSTLNKELKILEKDVENKITPPEFLDTLKETIAPLKQNYERWSYMMYLLNKPNRKSKEKRYDQHNKTLIDSDNTFEENRECIEKIKKLK